MESSLYHLFFPFLFPSHVPLCLALISVVMFCYYVITFTAGILYLWRKIKEGAELGSSAGRTRMEFMRDDTQDSMPTHAKFARCR